jgi:HEAT repeat protein
MAARDHLEAIFRADRAADEAEARLLGEADRSTLEEVLADAARAALDAPDRHAAARRLERLADLCAQVPGPRMVDTLLAILNDDDPAVRVAAGEALLDVGYDRYAEVARGIERALDAGTRGPGMAELPWIVAEIAEPSALTLIKRFLSHPEADVLAAAVEGLAALGDPEAIPALEELHDDERRVSFDDFERETSATISELAKDAIEELSAHRDDR